MIRVGLHTSSQNELKPVLSLQFSVYMFLNMLQHNLFFSPCKNHALFSPHLCNKELFRNAFKIFMYGWIRKNWNDTKPIYKFAATFLHNFFFVFSTINRLWWAAHYVCEHYVTFFPSGIYPLVYSSDAATKHVKGSVKHDINFIEIYRLQISDYVINPSSELVQDQQLIK
jgi:hypothetical protein